MSTSLGSRFPAAQIDAAVPTACPIAMQVPMTRAELWASLVEDIILPAISRFEMPRGIRQP